jgi:hypothetical protein
MSTDTNNAEESAPVRSTDPDQIESEIEATRDQMSETVDALSHKLDVKGQTHDRVEVVKGRAMAARERAQATWADPDARSEIIGKAAPAVGALAGVLVLLGVVRRARS